MIAAIGLIAYAVYYVYHNDGEIIENNEEVVSQEEEDGEESLRIGISNLDTLNPLISKNQNVQDISKFIYEPLFDVTSDFKLENCLGTEISKVDATTYLINTRENVKWHNGEPFVVDDVKYTIEMIKSLGDNSIYISNVSMINNVEIVGNNTLKIYLNEETPFFEYNLTFPIICKSFFSTDDIASSDRNNLQMGTGRYKLYSVDVNSQIDLIKNEEWWNKEAVDLRIDNIVIRVYGTVAELYNAYKLGGLDMVNSRGINIENNIGTIGANSQQGFGRDFDYLVLNCGSNILSNMEVRQAIGYAINRDEIINSVYAGKYKAGDFPLSYGSYLYTENPEAKSFNQEKAKQILQDGGWTLSGKVWQKKVGYSTIRLRINLVVQSENSNRVNVANIIKSNLEGIGIPVTVNSVKQASFDSYMKNKNYDMILTGVSVGISPNLSRYLSGGNLANFNNEEVNEILNDVKNISDEATLLEKYNRLQVIYETERPYVGLYFSSRTYVYNKNLTITGNNSWFNIYDDIENWHKRN